MTKEIHIGQLIKKLMTESGRKPSWLANEIACDPSNIHKIYRRQRVDTDLLADICVCLEVNLFPLYSEYVCEEIQKKRDGR